MERIKGAIFDLDGTLLDSLWVWEKIDERFLSKRGFAVPPDYSETIGAMGFRMTAEYTIKRFGLRESPEEIMAEWMDMARDIYAREVELKPHAREFLDGLVARGIKLGVATSSTSELFLPALVRHGIRDMFCVISETKRTAGKESPDVYVEVARAMGFAPAQCVVFEDLPVAIRSAKSAGFFTVAVRDKHSRNLESGIADYFADGFEELIKLLK